MAQEFSTEPLKTPERAASPGKMTYEEFLAWADEDTWAEWVNGEVIIFSPASKRHQDLVTFLAALLRFFVEARQLGLVLTAPFQMKIGPDLAGREPDLLFIAREYLDRLADTYLDGPADLVVEIISRTAAPATVGINSMSTSRAGCESIGCLTTYAGKLNFIN